VPIIYFFLLTEVNVLRKQKKLRFLIISNKLLESMIKYLVGFACCYYEHHGKVKDSIFSLNYRSSAKGTCFLVSRSGLAVSNYHPLESEPASNKDGVLIKVLAGDEELDLSLLQMPGSSHNSCLSLGDSSTLESGQVLYHFGFGMGSLIGNKGFFQGASGPYLLATTEMMHGQSGGPVLNEEGLVVGVCKGHFYCSPTKMREAPYHTGPSLYVSSNTVKEFLSRYCELRENQWELKL
jgi:S1-C subfamily serine protease